MKNNKTEIMNTHTKRTKFNLNWSFLNGDAPNAYKIEFDDSEWRALHLPHDWSIEGPFSKEYASATGYLPGGVGWYRKKFIVPNHLKGKKVFIQFDGVYKNSEVWINEQYLGKRPYGYSSFQYDVTPFLKSELKENIIAVKVDHTDFADSRWYTGSGIYRNVFMTITDQLYIKPSSIFITTPLITESFAEVQIQAYLKNEYNEKVNYEIVQQIKDANGDIVQEHTSEATIASNEEEHLSQSLFIEKPSLWSPDQPYMYEAVTKVMKAGEVIDTETTYFGVRSFQFDADSGLHLNGRNIKMKGVCIHHDAGCLGAAVPEKVWYRRLKLLKEAGVNAIRMSHNPPASELLDMCDRLGFIVQAEAFDEWEHPKNKWVDGWNVGVPSLDGYAADFAKWAEIDLRDMILRDRNHPSIIFWSIGNEIDYPNDPYSHPVLGKRYRPDKPKAEDMGEIAQKLAAVVRKYDPTRPVTAALASVKMSNETTYPDALDVVGYNYQESRYDEDHLKYPNRVIYGSENGRNHFEWQAVEQNQFISGQFIWTGIDYLGEAHSWPQRHATFGMLDLAGFKKPLYYFKQSQWSSVSMVYIGLTSIKEEHDVQINWDGDVKASWCGPEGEIVRVACCTNCPEVDLQLNGKSLGIKKRKDYPGGTIYWDVPYNAGTIIAVGLREGHGCCTHELHTAKEPTKLQLHSDTFKLNADNEDIAHIEVSIVDEDHHLVTDATNQIDCKIEGPGEIIGIECSNPVSHQNYKATSRNAFNGKLLIYVKATDQRGTINLTTSSKGLEGQSVTIEVK
ncbi:sugar-binding domain-containing protein [Metabacillus malikii]|uniref:Beta-galactosidase/beta-glucuronidase n=1 Tax=Metabacillus malikii TaxID=1504265 RepID=A0ABT9ZHK6_9BACI|nr:sugar-binding domain-containing protein [Metabacillus malikii]MDQ0230690.1 beta-galactosidase/beta-glucuronidase [Metabacillus malikii]